MPSKNQTVMKVNKSTLEMIREVGEMINLSPPKTLDRMVRFYMDVVFDSKSMAKAIDNERKS